MLSSDGDPRPDSTSSVSVASSPLSSPLSYHIASSAITADTTGIVQPSPSVTLEPDVASGDTQALGNEESFRALSLSDNSSSALPQLASFFDVTLPDQHLDLSGLEDEDGSGGSEKPFQGESNPTSTTETVAPPDDASPLSTHEPPVTKPILNPSAVPFFSVNAGMSPQDPAQDPVLLHTSCPPSQQPTLPFQIQMQLQAMHQLPLVNQQQLLAQLLVNNQILLQQQALLQPLPPLPLPLATPLPSPSTTIARASQELTFPPRSSTSEQPELTPHSAEAKLQKQREALARGLSSLSKAPESRSRSQDLSLSPQQETPSFPSPNDVQHFLRPKALPALDNPSHFSSPPSLGQAPAGSGEQPRAHSAEDNRHGFLQFQQWQKQQKQQGYDSSDMLRWVNEQGGPATASLNSDISPRPSTEQLPKVLNERYSSNVRFEHTEHELRNRPESNPGSLSPKHSPTPAPFLRQSFTKEREESWKPQLTVDPPAEQSWQTREKPQLTIDPPDRGSSDFGSLSVVSRSRSREEQWIKRKQFLELDRGSISPATSPSPSRPDWASLKQRSSFDSERGSTELHGRESWHARHSHDSGDCSSHSSSSRSRNEPWSPHHREYSRKSDERHQEFMQKPRQSFDSTLDVPSAPMSVSRSRSGSSSNLSKKIGSSKFNFASSEVHTPEENEDSSTGGESNAFQQSALQQTLLNQELLRQNLLMQVTMQMQQARQMQAALAQPGADEATINAAITAANSAATLAAQQLQYFQTMSMQNAAVSEFGSLSPRPSSPRGQDEPSKSPQRSFSSVDKGKLRSQERSRGSGTHSLPRRDGNSPPSPSPSPTNATSVPWLEAFRAAKGMDQLSLKEVVVRGWLKDLAMDQYGSRFLQRRLEAASQEHKHLAFDQLMQTGILPLCTDVFGNYVIQKFFDYSGPEHRATLATKLLGNVLQLSMQMYGCRVVQKAIELSEPPVQIQLVRELDGHVIECAEDQNGNHVVQKCLEKVAVNKLDFMVNAFKGQIARLATHPYGCRVIQRLLERWGSEASIVNELLGEHTDELCRNQYGNYVIQHLLIHGSDWQRSGIIHALLGKLFVLSKHKFASNVVENCFVYGSAQDRTALIQEVLGRHHESCLLSMVRDQYANYVVQKMIDLCDQDQLAMIVQRIKRHVPGLRKIPYGKNILTRLEKLTGTVFSGTTQLGSDAFPNSEMPSATIPFPGADNSATSSIHMNPSWGHSPVTRRSDGFRTMSIGRDSRDRGCPVFSGHRPLSIEADAGGFSGLDDQFDSYYAHLQSVPDGRTEFEGEM